MSKTVEYFDFLDKKKDVIEELLDIVNIEKEISNLRENYQDLPESTVSNVRRLAESFTKGIAFNNNIDVDDRDFNQLIIELKRRNIIDEDTSDILHDIRKIGNKGIHSGTVSTSQAEKVLISFERILRTYVTPGLVARTALTYNYSNELLMVSYQVFDKKIIYVHKKLNENPKKIGDTNVPSDLEVNFNPNSEYLRKHAHKRIKQYMTTAGVDYNLEWVELAVKKNQQFFRDHEVHEVLRRSGIENTGVGNEWFDIDLDTAKRAIAAVKEGRSHLTITSLEEQPTIKLRDEQLDAIQKTIKTFKKGRRMLWNAKMRFGKTLTTLQLIKEQQYKRVLILTHRPIVKDSWYQDFYKIGLDKEGYTYGSATQGANISDLINSDTPFVYFASIQDLRGSTWAGGSHEKNQAFLQIEWDLKVIDEAHEGNETELARNVKDKLMNDNTKVLELSGTPFNLLDKYDEDEVFTWDYTMEQRAKLTWDESVQGSNPYEGLPKINMYTFDMPNKADYVDAFKSFNFKSFFQVDDNGKFVHEQAVNSFLDVITTEDKSTNFPFSTTAFRNRLRHTLWLLPGVKEANALEALLNCHPVFKGYTVVNVVKAGDSLEEATDDDLDLVRHAIGDDPSATHTITLTVRKLTTGVNVPQWTGVMFLNNTESPTTYLQAAFRVQTPYSHESVGIKRNCYVFDFAPDRALKILTESVGLTSKKGKINKTEQREKLGELLNFLPVLGFSTNRMQKFNVDQMMSQIKKVYAEKAVRSGFEDASLYNDNLLNLDQAELNDFKDLKEIVGLTEKSTNKHLVQINETGFSEEQRDQVEKAQHKPIKERTTEESELVDQLKKANEQRRAMISILRSISIRIPMMIYGMQVELDKDINIDDFVRLVDQQSWEEFMPKGVSKEQFNKFAKYYDADVFVEAGRIIRQRAKSYDELDIIERAEKIALLFSTFKNPDKETVLTPWRVVNMQMVKSLGGYNFFDDDFKHTTIDGTPAGHFVCKPEGKDVYTVQSKILDINTKEGLHALFVAVSIYERELWQQAYNARRFNPAEIWQQVLENNIYAVAKTPMAKTITQRTLRGYNDKLHTNVVYIENLIETMKDQKDGILKSADKIREVFGDLKFDAVVGNPPYQDTTTGSSTRMPPVYHHFIELAKEVSNKFCLIHPARFLFNAGATPSEWNKQMLADEHLKIVYYTQNSADIFPNTDIKGGVAVTYRDAKESFGAIGVFTSFGELTSILKKVTIKKHNTLDTIMYPQTKVNIAIDERFPTERRIRPNYFDKFPEVFSTDKIDDKSYTIFGLEKGNKRTVRFVKSEIIDDPNILKYKIFIPAANGSGAIGEVISTPLVGEPLVGCAGTFLQIGSFDNLLEAENCMKYIKSKFARTMLGILKITQHNPPDVWSKVPLQDFTANSDIDWTVSIPEIDQQLYKKYNLSPDEIAFIEEKIRAME